MWYSVFAANELRIVVRAGGFNLVVVILVTILIKNDCMTLEMAKYNILAMIMQMRQRTATHQQCVQN